MVRISSPLRRRLQHATITSYEDIIRILQEVIRDVRMLRITHQETYSQTLERARVTAMLLDRLSAVYERRDAKEKLEEKVQQLEGVIASLYARLGESDREAMRPIFES